MLTSVSKPRPTAQRLRQTAASRAFGFIRLIAELGVLSSFAFSLMMFISGVASTYVIIRDFVPELGDAETSRRLLVSAIEQADTLLVATALLIISLGLQSLFVGRVANLPEWLHIHTIDDLKQKLLGVVVVALVVKFFSVAADWKGGPDILLLGGALAAVIVAAAAFSLVTDRIGRGGEVDAGASTPEP